MPLRRNRLVAWIAALAVMLQAFWPLLSHARPKAPSLLVPVCTINGITHYLDLKSGKTPLDKRTTLHGEHCKLCFFAGDRDVAPAPWAVTVFFVSNPSDSITVSRPVSFSDPANHSPAQPRAPPAFS